MANDTVFTQELERMLQLVRFPADKNDLLLAREAAKSGRELELTIGHLPSRTFEGPAEVQQAVQQRRPAPGEGELDHPVQDGADEASLYEQTRGIVIQLDQDLVGADRPTVEREVAQRFEDAAIALTPGRRAAYVEAFLGDAVIETTFEALGLDTRERFIEMRRSRREEIDRTAADGVGGDEEAQP